MEVYNILFNRLLSETAKQQASDLHLSVGSIPVLRKDGRLASLENEKIIEQETLSQIIDSFLTEEEQKSLSVKRDITVVKELGGHFRFKINVYYQRNLLAASFRLITETVRDLAALNLPEALGDFTRLSNGLLIVAGIYGSGKTTTIASLVENINQTQKKRVITLENFIEKFFVSKKSIIEQREIKKDVSGLVEGLKYCQTQDVDVLVISDIIDEFGQAIPLILEIASGSSLVILELNADSSVRVIEKIFESFPANKIDSAKILFADVLKGVIVQRLLPKNGGGQILAYELLVVNSAVASIIRENKLRQLETIIQTSGNEGMISMNTSLINLVRSGQITSEDAFAAASRKEEFNIMNR